MTAELWPYIAGITLLIGWVLWLVLAPVLKEEPVTEYHCARCRKLTCVLYRDGDVMVCRPCWKTHSDEYVGRQRLDDWQYDNRVDRNINKMDRYR